MKKVITFFSLSIGILISTSLQAKIWRVNNTGLAADFTTLQQAHDDALVLAGDTIHLEPSVSSYGSLNAYKRLIIIGPGYYLAQNFGLQANVTPALVDDIHLDPTSDATVITGITINNVFINASNVIFMRNRVINRVTLSTLGTTPTSNITIAQNSLGSYSIDHDFANSHGVSNVLITNNIMNSGIELNSFFSGIIENNFVTNNITVENFLVRNNIFISSGSITSTNGSVIYNISDCGSCLPVGNGNQNGATFSDIFVASGTSDGMYQLKSGSIATGSGQGGIDCGVFSGPNAYKLSGVPAVPAIYDLNVPINSTGDFLPIIISVRSNN